MMQAVAYQVWKLTTVRFWRRFEISGFMCGPFSAATSFQGPVHGVIQHQLSA
jgi:hypothetical protein